MSCFPTKEQKVRKRLKISCFSGFLRLSNLSIFYQAGHIWTGKFIKIFVLRGYKVSQKATLCSPSHHRQNHEMKMIHSLYGIAYTFTLNWHKRFQEGLIILSIHPRSIKFPYQEIFRLFRCPPSGPSFPSDSDSFRQKFSYLFFPRVMTAQFHYGDLSRYMVSQTIRMRISYYRLLCSANLRTDVGVLTFLPENVRG